MIQFLVEASSDKPTAWARLSQLSCRRTCTSSLVELGPEKNSPWQMRWGTFEVKETNIGDAGVYDRVILCNIINLYDMIWYHLIWYDRTWSHTMIFDDGWWLSYHRLTWISCFCSDPRSWFLSVFRENGWQLPCSNRISLREQLDVPLPTYPYGKFL